MKDESSHVKHPDEPDTTEPVMCDHSMQADGCEAVCACGHPCNEHHLESRCHCGGACMRAGCACARFRSVKTVAKLYGHGTNLRELEPHYSAHVSAMTSEGLHSKGDIAAELAFRDREIARLKRELADAHRHLSQAVARGELEP